MIIRAFNIDTEIRAAEPESLTREFVISTERLDSHGSIIKMDGWDITDFNRAGTFYYQHLTGGGVLTDPDPDNALGPASAMREGNSLIGIGKFEPKSINEKAAKIMAKVDYGTFRSTSVGFMPVKSHWGEERSGEDATVLYFDNHILKEFSIVHIPSNPDAIKKSMESMDAYMLLQLEEHKSTGYKLDIKRQMSSSRRQKYLLDLAMSRNYV